MLKPSQTALVVGATGFIGKFLIAQLLRDNARVFAICRNVDEQSLQIRDWLAQQNIDYQQLSFLQGDITQPDLGLSLEDWKTLKEVNYLYNTSALFKWHLSMQQAQAVNVDGLTNLLHSVNKHCHLERAVHLSGFMLTLDQHLQAVGIYREHIEKTDWPKIYDTLGAYEASKIQGHFNWIKQTDLLNIPWTIIHPATVIGDEITGEIPSSQPITALIQQLQQKKMNALPGTSEHSLPLVSVTMLVNAMLHASKDPHTLKQEILVANPKQIPFQILVKIIAQSLQINPPRHFISISFLKWILKWRWLANKLDMSPEMLNFLRIEQLDLSTFNQLNQQWKIPPTELKETMQKTVEWVTH
ncbi:NAD-dependent epimerase/dehydratase family protein [Acinetobacter sp. ANC 4910]|uniref:SDR family oxidoreductase n=1 Tax=Acinetobacter sp. ANC 4910 TaxID=2529850 RepID=UPI00103ACBBC|nr:SDR family oxidoreductase [Acinetobacter sp. ANC 4910]TCB33833.1 NAD-dependent epimerase/dehydratase family protein [Acinetobacter sp. ANC 4910]